MASNQPFIRGGYIILARKILESEVMDKPPLYLKLWVWMLEKANHKDGYKNLKRGQFVTTIREMQQVMTYKIGYRKIIPTKDQIRNAYEYFSGKLDNKTKSKSIIKRNAYEASTKPTMITTTKTTRGMVITILNYDKYQNPKNYESHNEAHNENSTKPTVTPHDKQETKKEQEGNSKDQRHKVFQEWWFEKFRYKFQKDYLVTNWKQFGAQIKSLLKLPVSFEDLQYLVMEFLLDEDPFITGSEKGNGTGHNIGMFLTRINQNAYQRYLEPDFRETNKGHILDETGNARYSEEAKA